MRGRFLTATMVALTAIAVSSVVSALEPATSAGAAAVPTPTAAAARAPLAEELSPWLAIVVGSVGSAAYLIALWVGLVGTAGGKERILTHFRELWGLKIPLFVMSGGAVAMVFQLPEGKLIPVQAFIIGCTWPAVVSNYLSGRQSGDGEAQARAAADLQADTDQLALVLEAVPAPKAPHSSAKAEFERLKAVVENAQPLSGPAAPGQQAPGQPPSSPTPNKTSGATETSKAESGDKKGPA